MSSAFNPIEELRRHGLYGDSVSAATEQALHTLTASQVQAVIDVTQHADALHSQTQSDSGLALAMSQAMGWDRPRVDRIGAEVEGMSGATVECACLCTGGGGGGGRH